MPPTPAERSLYLNPLVPESVRHNTTTVSQIRSLSSILLGVAAGILGLESQWGFLFYFVSQFFISGLIHFVLAKGSPGEYFAGSGTSVEVPKPNGKGKSKEMAGAWRDVWLGSGLFEGLSGFVLGWAGTPWTSFATKDFPPRAARQKRRVLRSTISSEPKLYPLEAAAIHAAESSGSLVATGVGQLGFSTMSSTSSLSKRGLMSLPSEILESIIDKVFPDSQLYIINGKDLKWPKKMSIRLPHSLLVSKTYFKLAKAAALQQATIAIPHKFDIDRARISSLLFSPDFRLLQYLDVRSWIHTWRQIDERVFKAMLSAAPQLRKLTVDGPKIWGCRGYTSTGHRDRDDPVPFTVTPGPDLPQHIKQKFEEEFRFKPINYRVPNFKDMGGLALHAWLTRNKDFELCFVARVKTHTWSKDLCGSPGGPRGGFIERHLWDVTFSTHTPALAVKPGDRPGNENCNPDQKEEAEFDIPIDPSFFENVYNSPDCQMVLQRFRNAEERL
ncbi:uncharacterized protein AB675_4849 [Cyphellophora attinorum]|uniref:ER membrane protein complex subunit 6 n=1 Tax=Cyphellophora attinorum TaxID=1664694 RepID=A0A0N0NHM0_9EURO|nr:uncharacterized protein AB675_4849 [Phialophora attinorum]KPI34841.1 hypothetical protein AB675_4849 [Phialophora attinorum]